MIVHLYVDSSLCCYIKFPAEGFTKILAGDEDIPKDSRLIEWENFNTDDAFAKVLLIQ